jgi:hypothetical protein
MTTLQSLFELGGMIFCCLALGFGIEWLLHVWFVVPTTQPLPRGTEVRCRKTGDVGTIGKYPTAPEPEEWRLVIWRKDGTWTSRAATIERVCDLEEV